jgi:hypothetical protein
MTGRHRAQASASAGRPAVFFLLSPSGIRPVGSGLACCQGESLGCQLTDVIARHVGMSIGLLDTTAEDPSPGPRRAGTGPTAGSADRSVTCHDPDGTVLIDGDYVIRGVAGPILFAMLTEYQRSGRTRFLESGAASQPGHRAAAGPRQPRRPARYPASATGRARRPVPAPASRRRAQQDLLSRSLFLGSGREVSVSHKDVVPTGHGPVGSGRHSAGPCPAGVSAASADVPMPPIITGRPDVPQIARPVCTDLAQLMPDLSDGRCCPARR